MSRPRPCSRHRRQGRCTERACPIGRLLRRQDLRSPLAQQRMSARSQSITLAADGTDGLTVGGVSRGRQQTLSHEGEPRRTASTWMRVGVSPYPLAQGGGKTGLARDMNSELHPSSGAMRFHHSSSGCGWLTSDTRAGRVRCRGKASLHNHRHRVLQDLLEDERRRCSRPEASAVGGEVVAEDDAPEPDGFLVVSRRLSVECLDGSICRGVEHAHG